MQSRLDNANRRIKTAHSTKPVFIHFDHLRHRLKRGAIVFVTFETYSSQWQLPVGTITDCFSKLLISSAFSPPNTLSICVQWAWKTKPSPSAILDFSISFHDCIFVKSRPDVQKDIPDFMGPLDVATLFTMPWHHIILHGNCIGRSPI